MEVPKDVEDAFFVMRIDSTDIKPELLKKLQAVHYGESDKFERLGVKAAADMEGSTLGPVPATRTHKKSITPLAEAEADPSLMHQEVEIQAPGMPPRKPGARPARRERMSLIPDALQFKPGDVVTIEVTLDSTFSDQRVGGNSRKLRQVVGTVDRLALKYPQVQIRYQIITKAPPPRSVVNEVAGEVRKLQKTHSNFKIIWLHV